MTTAPKSRPASRRSARRARRRRGACPRRLRCRRQPTRGDGAGNGEFTYLGQTENTTIIGTLESLADGSCAPTADEGRTAHRRHDRRCARGTSSSSCSRARTPCPNMSHGRGHPIAHEAVHRRRPGRQPLRGARRARRRRQDPSRRRVDHQGALRRRRPLRTADRAQHRGLLVQQAAPRRQRRRGARRPGTTSSTPRTTLKAAGVQPFSAAGKDGWPVTRLVGNYIFRDLGPDALQKVADGEAKLTDPEYVDGGRCRRRARQGRLLRRRASARSTTTTAMNQFLTGRCARSSTWAAGRSATSTTPSRTRSAPTTSASRRSPRSTAARAASTRCRRTSASR